MKKFLKWLFVFAAAGSAIGFIIAYLCKGSADESSANDMDFTEDEDFDLDVDLKPASEREYFSLHRDEEPASSDGEDTEASSNGNAGA